MRTRTPICDSCQILVINNIACHEHGCPNRNKPMQYRKRNKPMQYHKPINTAGLGKFKP